MTMKPVREHHYELPIFDSKRWDQFTPRSGDIIVCTSYKAGTTWTQMICALLIHNEPVLPAPLGQLSPWLDVRFSSIDNIIANLNSQNHRRIIKTHTPLDGLPYYDNVDYVVCGRDPRDVFMSLQNHLSNGTGNPDHIVKLMIANGATFPSKPPDPLPADIQKRFQLWLSQASFPWEQDGLPYWSHFRHMETFWKYQDLPNIHLIHYANLKKNLSKEMKQLAIKLDIKTSRGNWDELVAAASFESMKANADHTAPDTQHKVWINNSNFFHKGESGQWRGVLDSSSLDMYEKVSRERYDVNMLHWLENGY